MWGEWLQEPQNGCAIVFIHGLFSSSETAWRSEKTNWPNLVQEEAALSGYGVYLFDYEAKISAGNYSLSDASTALNEYFGLDGLRRMRQTIFVAHSMGGIVARHFIVSRRELFIETQMTLGLFLIASPSLGSDYANLLVNVGLIHNVQLDSLQFTHANAWLLDLDQQFMNLKEKRSFPLFGRELIEADPTILPRIFFPARQIVPLYSANRYFGEALKIPRSDHISIAKPANRDALQHRVLVQFIREHSPAAETHPASTSTLSSTASPDGPISDDHTEIPQGLDPLTRVAIAANRHRIDRLPDPKASTREIYDVAIELASGRMMERMLASWLTKRHGDPVALCRVGLDVPETTEARFRRSLPWLRFGVGAPEFDWRTVVPLAERAVAKFTLSEPDNLRLKAAILGKAGEDAHIPEVDWNDAWSLGKYAYDYTRAYIDSASVLKREYGIERSIRRAIEIGIARVKAERSLHFFDYLSAFRTMPAANASIVMNALIENKAPPPMLEAFLARLCLIPNERTLPALRSLSLHESPEIARAARMAAAFIPSRNSAIGEAKKNVIYEVDGAFAIMAGVDKHVAALGEVEKLLGPYTSEHSRYAAAWSLGRLARVDSSAKSALLHYSKESGDALVRAILLASLAFVDPQAAAPAIAAQRPQSLGIELFVLLIGQSYITDAKPLFSMLASASEDELYVPFMLPMLQLMFLEALLHASTSAPWLAELWALGDMT